MATLAAAALIAVPAVLPNVNAFAAATNVSAVNKIGILRNGINYLYDDGGRVVGTHEVYGVSRQNVLEEVTINGKQFYKTDEDYYYLKNAMSLTSEPVKEKVKEPDFPSFDIPDIKIPDTKIPEIKVPDVKLPDVEVPDSKDSDVKKQEEDKKADDKKEKNEEKSKESETKFSEVAARGNFKTGSISGATVYNQKGTETGQILPANTMKAFVAVATINGKDYYKFNGGYVLKSDVTTIAAPADKVAVKGTVHVAAKAVIKYNDTTAPVGTLNANTSWKIFFKTTINGVPYYNLGGNQYVKVGDVSMDTPAKPVPLRAVGTVHYVPGYGIQVWTQKHGFVYNADGSKKKLAHGTSWKVFSQMNIKGTVYYNLGGDQWMDANYINLKK